MMNFTEKCSLRTVAALFAVMMLLSVLLPTAIFAEEAAEDVAAVPALYVEPTVITADDYTTAVTGFSVYSDNPDDTPLTFSYVIRRAGEDAGTVNESAPETLSWVTVTVSEPPVENGEGNADIVDNRPDYVVDFHKPADINVEDAAYLAVPEFLRAVKVGDADIYCFAPGYAIDFRVTGGTPSEDGVFPIQYETTFCEDTLPLVSFNLERPQKFMAKLTQNEYANGQLSTYYYYPESIRAIADRLNNDKDAFLSAYGITDAALYVQYDLTRLDTPSVYNPEEEADRSMLWGKEFFLYPPIITSAPEEMRIAHYIDGTTFVFNDENFRARFPEETFAELPVIYGEAEDAPENTLTYWQIDTESTTLTVRARFVLAMTDDDGTVYYNTSSFTDPFSCGASNSLVAEPTEMRAPVLSDPVFETEETGGATLSFHVESNETLLDTTVWLNAMGMSPVTYDLDISVNGGDWVPCTAENEANTLLLDDGDWILHIDDENLNEYAYIRLRMRYTAQLSEDIALHSEWSDSLAFDKKPAETVTEPVSVNTLPLYTEETEAPGELKYVCPICGICPAPYGVCLFLWIGAALLIVLLVVLIIALIPKKKTCPRCSAPCHPADKSCAVCGYRFVGSMPEIEDTTSDVRLPENAAGAPPSDEDFFAAMSAKEGDAPVFTEKTPVHVPLDDEPIAKPQAQKPAAKASASEQPPASAPASEPISVKPVHTPLPAADPAFLAELKRKMAAVKNGQPQSFTPAEIAYIRAMKEQKAAKAAAAKPAAPVAQQPNAPVITEEPAKTETNEERIARLRALRAKQLEQDTEEAVVTEVRHPTAQRKAPVAGEAPTVEMNKVTSVKDTPVENTPVEDSLDLLFGEAPAPTSAPAPKAPAEKTPAPDMPKRVEKPKPVRRIKCPACAVPNPETNDRCYICGGELPK